MRRRPKYLSERDLDLFKRAVMSVTSIESEVVRAYAMNKVLEYVSDGWAWSGQHEAIEELMDVVERMKQKDA